MWRGPAAVFDVDETGAAVKFRGQAVQVARFCVWMIAAPKDVGSVYWDCVSGVDVETDMWPSLMGGRRTFEDPLTRMERGARGAASNPVIFVG